MKIGYYPGCSLHSTAIEYDMSTRAVCKVLGVELCEIKDWICCGSSPAEHSDEVMSLAMSAKNIARAAETDGIKEICAPCASCYSRLKATNQKMADADTKNDIEYVIGQKVPDDMKILHLLDVFTEKFEAGAIAEKVVKNLNGMKVVCYYGCLMTRPPKVTGKDNFENPTEMEAVLEELGAEALDWNMKTFCCGASFALTKTEMALELIKKILDDAASVGADAIATGCPLCNVNLDTRQVGVNKKFGTDFNIPVFYFTELMGLALGIDAKKLGIGKHITEVDDFLKERSLI